MERWVGKIAVVTGASSGIGAAIAKDLADRGVVVVAVARRLDNLEKLTNSTTGKIHPRKCDLQNEAEILSTFRWVESTLGGVDVLVNNAGVSTMSPLMSGETEQWQKMFDINVRALNICTREALKTMRQRGDNGHIFHINSVAGHRVRTTRAFPIGLYASTKHAVTALTEAMRIELQHADSQIKITSISPGLVMTEMIEKLLKQPKIKLDSIASKPGSILNAEDISEALLYALQTKPHVQVHEIIIQPLGQTFN